MADGEPTLTADVNKPTASDRLDSWKEIASYLGRDVRTVQRWEKIESLPVRRQQHTRLASVYAYKSELDAWLQQRTADIEKTPARSEWRRVLPILIGSALLASLVVAWKLGRLTPPSQRRIPQIAERQLTSNPRENLVSAFDISPDGKHVALVDQTGMYVRLTETGETHPFVLPEGFRPVGISWFPDGSKLLLTAYGPESSAPSLWVVPSLGGVPRKFRDDASGASVAPDGSSIAFLGGHTPSHEIWVMRADGEDAQKIASAQHEEVFGQVAWSPDGQRVAYTVLQWEEFRNHARLEISDRKGGPATVILSSERLLDLPGAALPFVWTPDGRIIYARRELPPNDSDSNLWEVRVNQGSAGVSGEPQRLTHWTGFAVLGLSATRDGTRLICSKAQAHSDVYVVELNKGAIPLGSPRRLTFDDRDDWPGSWTADSRAVFFASNRTGSSNIFKQGLERRTAEALTTGLEEKADPQLTADGSKIFYWAWSSSGLETPRAKRLMRIRLADGSSELALTASFGASLRCPRSGTAPCVLGDRDGNQLIFSAFDPVAGKGRELGRIGSDPSDLPSWSLSPDGSQVAIVEFGKHDGLVRLLSLATGMARQVSVKDWDNLQFVAWSADAKSLYLTNFFPHVILHVDLSGQVSVLWRTAREWPGLSLASPDGRYLAFADYIFNSNLWMIEKF